MNMKKIMIIMDGYPPSASPNDLCVNNVIELLKQKYDILILTRCRIGRKNEENINGVKVIRVFKGPLDILGIWASMNKGTARSNIIYKINYLKTRVIQILTIPIYPVFAPIYQWRLSRKAVKECTRNSVDAVISVCFPPESLIAGQYIRKKIPDTVYVPYFIDAYACGTYPRYLPYKYAFNRKIRYERKMVSGANAIVAMESSRKFHEEHNSEFYKNIKYLNPTFLVKPKLEKSSIKSDLIEEKMINILYTGYLYLPDRDPSFLIKLISSWHRKDVCLIFVGGGKCKNIILSAKKAFSGVLKYSDFLPHEEVLQLIDKADVLINMGVSNSNAISGKIFEYMAFGKPILSTFFREDDASLKYLRRYPLSCCINQETMDFETASCLSKQFVENNVGKVVPFEQTKKMFYSSTPEAFVDVIDSIL